MKIITCFKLVPEEQDIVVTPEYTLNFDNADAKISQFDLNAIEAASQLATDDDEIAALTVGGSLLQNSKVRKDVLSRGPHSLYMVQDAQLEHALPLDTAKALAARLSVQLNAALVNDATAVDIVDGHICAEHRMYGGLAFAQEKINSSLAIITLAPGVQEPCTSDTSHQCPTETVPYVAPRHEILCRERRAKAASSVDLSKAKRVVGVGRGLAAQDDLKMVHELAAVLNAEVGCSRPIAEGENWMERERYIGVSGVLLKSDLYLTLGISGQIQHMVGGNGAKVIVAINKDKNAPIFNYADYGLVGDIYKVVPALISQLSR